MRLWSQVSAARRGQNVVELAISLWVFLFIGFGLVEGGMLAWNNGTLQHAVEEGARYALRATKTDGTPMDEATVKSAVIFAGYGLGLTASDVTVRVCPVGTACDALCGNGNTYSAARQIGQQIRICAQYTYQPLFSTLITGTSSLTLQRQAQIRVE
jgi:Flp pilus assembly protein TadG